MQRQNNANQDKNNPNDQENSEPGFWDGLEAECLAALPPLYLRSGHSESALLYENANVNGYGIEQHISSVDISTPVENEQEARQDAAPSQNQAVKKRKRAHGEVSKHDLKFLLNNEVVEGRRSGSEKKSLEDFPFFFNTSTKESKKKDSDPDKKANLDHSKKRRGK